MQTDIPDDTDQHLEEPADERPLLSVPVAFGLALAFIAVTLGGSYWLVRARNQPSPDEGIPVGTVLAREGTVFPSPTAVSSRVPTAAPAATSALVLAQQPTGAAPTSVAQSTPLPTAADATTATPPSLAADATTSALTTPTVAEASAVATSPATQAAEPDTRVPATTEPISAPPPPPVEIGAGCLAQVGVPVGPAKDVADAYLRYFDVSGQALYQLDSGLLDEVAAGAELAALSKNIDEDRAAGRAVRTDVEHYCVVLSVDGDNAIVGDDYRDSSIYVDPATHTPLPGQKAPASPEVAKEYKVIYQLQRLDNIWKVVDGEMVQS